MLAVVVGARATRARAQDDWHVTERHTKTSPAQAGAAATAPAPQASADGTFVACGEQARPAGEPYKTIVAQLNDMWGTKFPVYETVSPAGPHSSTGGCIFYNEQYLNAILKQWMKIDDDHAVRPMLYGVFAHELGHQAHGDLDPANENIPTKNKELAADQFAGYSLQRMGLRRLDPTEVTHYWLLMGDDFGGRDSGHGNGEERIEAFQNGWHRAELGLPEEGTTPAGGLGEP
jgi:hypothetical protein